MIDYIIPKEVTKETAENVVKDWVNGASPPVNLPKVMRYILNRIEYLEKKVDDIDKNESIRIMNKAINTVYK